jgi:hypothetical protein
LQPNRTPSARAQARSSLLRLLDLGCGHGRISNSLAERGARVTGLEGSSYFLDIARRHAAARSLDVTFVEGAPPRPKVHVAIRLSIPAPHLLPLCFPLVRAGKERTHCWHMLALQGAVLHFPRLRSRDPLDWRRRARRKGNASAGNSQHCNWPRCKHIARGDKVGTSRTSRGNNNRRADNSAWLAPARHSPPGQQALRLRVRRAVHIAYENSYRRPPMAPDYAILKPVRRRHPHFEASTVT